MLHFCSWAACVVAQPGTRGRHHPASSIVCNRVPRFHFALGLPGVWGSWPVSARGNVSHVCVVFPVWEPQKRGSGHGNEEVAADLGREDRNAEGAGAPKGRQNHKPGCWEQGAEVPGWEVSWTWMEGGGWFSQGHGA